MKNKRLQNRLEAEEELKEKGFQISRLEYAYNRPNIFNSTESDESFQHFKLFSSKAGNRFIVAKDGAMYYIVYK